MPSRPICEILGALGVALGLGAAATGCSGCRRSASPHPPAELDAGDRGAASDEPLASLRCAPDTTFPPTVNVAEASAAAEVELTPGVRELAVVADSGNDGAALLLPLTPTASGVGRTVTLAIDDPGISDDIEGIAWREGVLYTLTSSGGVRQYRPDGKGGLVRQMPGYAIGPTPYSCKKLSQGNCGKNWEGLCLHGGREPTRCVGYAASKEENALYCVVMSGNRIVIDGVKPPLKLALPSRALSDCAFGTADGPGARTLVVTTNIHGGSRSYVVDEGSGALARIDVPGHVTNEAIAIDHDGALYQFEDNNHSPSAAMRVTCSGF